MTFQPDISRTADEQPSCGGTAGAPGPAAIHEQAHPETHAYVRSRDVVGGRNHVLQAGVGQRARPGGFQQE